MRYLFFLLFYFLFFQSITAQNKGIEIFESLSDCAFKGRGCGGSIVLYAPRVSYILGETICIQWKLDEKASSYTIVFTDLADDITLKKETTENKVWVSPNTFRYEKDTLIIYRINSTNLTGISGEPKLLIFYPEETRKVLFNERDQIENSSSFQSPLEKYLALASFCEKNKLYVEAINMYANAFSMNQQLEKVEEEYLEFLRKISPEILYYYKKK